MKKYVVDEWKPGMCVLKIGIQVQYKKRALEILQTWNCTESIFTMEGSTEIFCDVSSLVESDDIEFIKQALISIIEDIDNERSDDES